jgi:hypothetical protein
MLRLEEETFGGQACLRLENEALTVWIATAIGPRLLGLALHGEPNLFAELPDLSVECPGMGDFHFRGGHRLWHAPEEPRRTYIPDDAPVKITRSELGVRLTQEVEPFSGILKEMLVHLPENGAQLEIEHILTNRGAWTVELAPWAITQLKTGGQAVLPLTAPLADASGLLPNRNLVFWPYSDLTNPLLKIGRLLLFFRATMQSGAFKVGTGAPSGWLAYLLGDTLFAKRASTQRGAAYFDLGCSSELYCNKQFIELETLGPRTRLAPGEAIHHGESWSLHSGFRTPADEAGWIEALAQVGLDLGTTAS